MKVRFFNIIWDTEEEEWVTLPNDVTLDIDDDLNVNTEGADILSDQYGWCVNSFNYEFPSN